jgi:anti-sigma factor RsiW
MSGAADMPEPSDEQLVAYLDGELPLEARAEVNRALAASESARDRLEFLRSGDRPFAEALDSLLDQAPTDRLLVSLGPTPEVAQPQVALPQGARGWAPMAAAAAVLVALFGGFLGGMVAPGIDQPTEIALVDEEDDDEEEPAIPERGWRQAVADYQVLFTADSLTPYQGGDSGLDLANAALGIPIDSIADDLTGLNFRKVQLLQFKNKVLVQVAYLSHAGKPVSFCIIASGKPEQAVLTEQRNGLEIIHWILAGYGFMVIGDMPQDELQAVADDLMQRVGI